MLFEASQSSLNYKYLKLIVESFLTALVCLSSFNTTIIFCFVLLIPQPKVLDYAKIFVVCVNCTVWLLPPPPFNFRQAETLHFIDFKNTRTLYPVSVIYMYMNLQIFQIKNSEESRFPGWVGAKGRLGIKIRFM